MILDLGCGYGGRTVYYAIDCGARHIEGVEVAPDIVLRCRRLAEELQCANATFSVGFAQELPFPPESFDSVVSYDVLEHVEDPVRAFAEISRVLRPGGEAWLVFPSYLGARASHLDYLTRLPALHRLFDPDIIVQVVNEFLTRDPSRYGVKPQPAPKVGILGRRVLPTLNGITLRDARQLVARAGLTVRDEVLTPFVAPTVPVPGARVASRMLALYQRHFELPELLLGSIALCLVKPEATASGAPASSAPS